MTLTLARFSLSSRTLPILFALSCASGCGDSGHGPLHDAATTGDAASDSSAAADASTAPDSSTDGGFSAPPTPTVWTAAWPPPNASHCEGTDIWVTALAVHDTRVWVGTRCGEVFRTDDLGSSWTPLPTPLTRANAVRPVEDLLFVGDVLFTVLRSPKYDSTSMADQGPVYRSTDFGDTWVEFQAGFPTRVGGQLVLVYDLHVASNRLFAATWGAGVQVSPLDQADWQPFSDRSTSPAEQGLIDACPNVAPYVDPISNQPFGFLHSLELADDGADLFVSTKCGGVYRTSLATKQSSWAAYSAGLPFFGGYYQEPFALYVDGGYLYAGIDDEGAYRSPLGGAPAFTFITATGNFVSTNKFDPIVFSRIGGALYMGTSFSGLYTSADGTSPWTLQGAIAPGVSGIGTGADIVSVLGFDATHVFVGTSTGFYVGQ